jgi:hypothetical protein
MKDELQNKITEYSKLVESGMCLILHWRIVLHV